MKWETLAIVPGFSVLSFLWFSPELLVQRCARISHGPGMVTDAVYLRSMRSPMNFQICTSKIYSIKLWLAFLMLVLISFCTGTFANTPADCDQLIDRSVELLYQKLHVESLELLVKARAMADANKWYKQEFLAVNNMGANYYSMGDYGEALSHYLEARAIAIGHLDGQHEMIVLNNIGILYFQEKKHERALEFFTEAYNLAHANGDTVKVGYYATNLALLSNKMGDLDAAAEYIAEAGPMLTGYSAVLKQVDLARAENHLFRGELEKAESVAQAVLKTLDGVENSDNKLFILEICAKIYEKRNNLSEALRYAYQAFDVPAALENKIILMEYMSELHIKNLEYDKALQLKDSVILAKDFLFERRNTNLYESNKIKYEIQNYQRQLSASQEALSQQRFRFFLYSSLAAVCVLFVIWILRNNSTKHRQRKKIAELELEKERTSHILLEKQLREKETQAQLEQERLKNEVESRNRKLAVKALHMSSRNELIEEVIVSLSDNPEIVRNVDLKGNIENLRSHLKKDHQWDSFYKHFEEINQGFLDRLRSRHPDLQANEIRFISYVYMNLNNKEISTLLNITDQSCRKRKERIAKKLHIPSDLTLYHYLSNI